MSKTDLKSGFDQKDLLRSEERYSTMEVIDRIIEHNTKISRLWSDGGWASNEAARLLSKSRLDRQISLSRTLSLWLPFNGEQRCVDEVDDDGRLILGWANLGALVEGSMKWFLSVYLKDYQKESELEKIVRGKEPDVLTLEPLRGVFNTVVWTSYDDFGLELIEYGENSGNVWIEWDHWIRHVQQRRNAIHAYRERDLGTLEELERYIHGYWMFLQMLNISVPDLDPKIYPW